MNDFTSFGRFLWATIRSWFGVYSYPKIGSKWVLAVDGGKDPFRSPCTVTVKACKAGWVQYIHASGGIDAMSLPGFVSCHEVDSSAP